MKRVTVFTPTYNRAKVLHRVYDSLVSQTYTDFQWLIVDDGSVPLPIWRSSCARPSTNRQWASG